jgi:glycerol-3-phosphate dehydrogenase
MSDNFDLIVIGAGINGAGIARDAAMRGLTVLLLDKGDIGGGTSSVSTRLIHGGLRYLEHGEIGLVRESLREREILFRIAPHLVKPLPLLIPIYKTQRRGWLTIQGGMIAYDLLSYHKSLPRHRMLSPEETLEHAPGLNTKDLIGTALYFDAQVEFAERLVLENVLSATEVGTRVLTYAVVNSFQIEGGRIAGVQFTEKLGGTLHCAGARAVINAAGPWVDEVLSKAERPSERMIGGTKGSHIVVSPFSGAPKTALYVEAETDQRPFFVIPWNGQYLIGTTDSRYEGDLDNVEINNQEKEYLLRETIRLFPRAGLSRDSIKFSYSGIRPLAFSNHRNEPSISRRHFVREHPEVGNLISIVGGKLTTYRHLSEEAVDLVMRKLRKQSVRCTTAERPLPGARCADFQIFCEDFRRENVLSGAISNRLLRIYGTRAADVLKLASENPSLGEVFDEEAGALAAEVVFSFERELAQSLADCLLRRTMVGLNSSRGMAVLEHASRIAREHLNWTEARANEEVQAYRKSVGVPDGKLGM